MMDATNVIIVIGTLVRIFRDLLELRKTLKNHRKR